MRRKDGDIQPGLKWSIFTLRIPFVHAKVSWPDLLQGMMIGASTGLALVPVMTTYLGLTFEEAVAMTVIHVVLINSSWFMFGEPYAPGWVTPALPFVLLFVISESFPTPESRFQVMTALSIDLAIILAILGLTGLGSRLINFIPEVFKGAIIFGAAIAAFLNVFDLNKEDNIFHTQPYTVISALALSLILTFSAPLKKWQKKNKWLAVLVSLGLLPGFVLGAIVSSYNGELVFDIQSGWVMLPMASMWEKVSPFSIGWPGIELFIEAFPLAFITYVLVFGDLITGEAIIKEAEKQREDEKLDINHNRTHLSIAIRNVVMSITAPFFPTQGTLWTGIHVLIIERWKSGRKNLDSFYDGVNSYYVFGLPILLFYLPVLTAMQPLLRMALAMTLVLTGFACAYIAMAKAHTTTQRGCIVLSGIFLALFEPWLGLSLAVIATLILVDFSKKGEDPISSNSSDSA